MTSYDCRIETKTDPFFARVVAVNFGQKVHVLVTSSPLWYLILPGCRAMLLYTAHRGSRTAQDRRGRPAVTRAPSASGENVGIGKQQGKTEETDAISSVQ